MQRECVWGGGGSWPLNIPSGLAHLIGRNFSRNLRNRRRSQGSDTGDEGLQDRHSSSGAEDSGEYGPLGAGGYGEGRGENGATAQHTDKVKSLKTIGKGG